MQRSRTTWLATLGTVAATLALFAGQVSAGTVQLTQNATTRPNGSSTTKSFGSVIIGAPITTNEFGLRNNGAGNETVTITAGGLATVSSATFSPLSGFSLAGNTTSLNSLTVGIATSAFGPSSGTITVHQAGQPAATTDDKINLSVSVHDHSNASFNDTMDVDTLFFELDGSPEDGGTSEQLSLTNLASLVAPPGNTAGLDFLGFTASGDTSVLTIDMVPYTKQGVGAANSVPFNVSFDTSTLGKFSATYVLHFSDDVTVPGHTLNHDLTLRLQGLSTPEPATWLLLATGLVGLLSYRWRRRAA